MLSKTIDSAPAEGVTLDIELPALRLVQSPRGPRRLARALIIAFIVTAVSLIFLPWQQTASGTGQVTAYSPLDRPQAIPAPITGRIVDWYGHREGSRVQKGDVIVEIQDNDPNYLARLNRAVEQAEFAVDAAEATVSEYDLQIDQLAAYRDFTVAAANSVLETTRQKVASLEKALEAANAEQVAAELNFNRKKPLAEMGYESDRTLDLATRDKKAAEADVKRITAELEGARADVEAKKSTMGSLRSDGDAKIAKARAEREDAAGKLASAEKELLSAETARGRQQRQFVESPVDGTILRLQAASAGDQVKAGDPLFLVVPDAFRRAVELWVDGNDATLIEPGRKVRLVFEGFPGIQFSGWPSVAVGTFGGVVNLVDATDNGEGMFRVLVLPDESDQPWPKGPYLRQGVKANGWVLLNRVPLWFEVWRRLNGFPPTVPAPDGETNYSRSYIKKG